MAEPNDNLYLQGLPGNTTEQFLKSIFGQYGLVKSIKILPIQHGKNEAAAMMKMGSISEAQWMVENLSNNIAQGMTTPVNITFAVQTGKWSGDGDVKGKGDSKGKGKSNNGYGPSGGGGGIGGGWGGGVGKGGGGGPQAFDPNENVYVTGLPFDMDDARLRSIFSLYGNIVSLKLLPVNQGKNAAAAMIRFGSVQEAQWLVNNLNNNIPQGMATPVSIVYTRPYGGGGGGPPKGGGGKGSIAQGQWFVNNLSNNMAQSMTTPVFDPNENVYVTGLPFDMDDARLRSIFSVYGNIVSLKVLPVNQGKKAAAAMIRFGSVPEAQWLVNNLNNNIPQGMATPVNIVYTRPYGGGGSGSYKGSGNKGKDNGGGKGKGGGDGGGDDATNLYIKKLPGHTTEQMLWDVFGQYGSITSVKLLPMVAGKSEAAAFVRFGTVEEANWLITNLNGNIPQGMQTPVDVSVAVAKDKGGKGGGG